MEQHGTLSCLNNHDIEAYTDTVTCFIRKCSTDKNKALSTRTSAFKSGNTDDRNQASYDLRKSIKAAKRQYKNKVEEQFNTNNTRGMWQGINNITGFKGNKPATLNITASLPDKLKRKADEVSALFISITDVIRSFRRVNIRKAVGPDGIPDRVLRVCGFQIFGVSTNIFNLSLSLSVVPPCFKKSTILPIPKKKKNQKLELLEAHCSDTHLKQML